MANTAVEARIFRKIDNCSRVYSHSWKNCEFRVYPRDHRTEKTDSDKILRPGRHPPLTTRTNAITMQLYACVLLSVR